MTKQPAKSKATRKGATPAIIIAFPAEHAQAHGQFVSLAARIARNKRIREQSSVAA